MPFEHHGSDEVFEYGQAFTEVDLIGISMVLPEADAISLAYRPADGSG